ncbi:MAG: CapA family protein [Lachnospiraceae bacterium]|nr:CapA family protein [Lachnospiraceae bacterium]
MKNNPVRIYFIMCIFVMCLCTHTCVAYAKGDVTTITISAAGDTTLGIDSRYCGTFNSYYNDKGSAYFLKNVRPYFGNDDITIVNFEGTLTESTSRAAKKYTFKGPAKHVKVLKKGSVEVVTLANNHSFDFGKRGFEDTKHTLKKNKIKFCRNKTIAYKKVKGVKVAFIGFSQLEGVSENDVKTAIKTAKKKSADIVIVSFHWGIERDYYPSGRQKYIGRYAIKAGASLVLGHHPHVLQGIEKYKGRYIVYSLGNFCFGGNVNPDDKDTMIFQQTFYVKKGKLLKKSDAKVIPCSLSGKTYTNDYQPTPLKEKGKKRLIQKINRLSHGMNVKVGRNGKLK